MFKYIQLISASRRSRNRWWKAQSSFRYAEDFEFVACIQAGANGELEAMKRHGQNQVLGKYVMTG